MNPRELFDVWNDFGACLFHVWKPFFFWTIVTLLVSSVKCYFQAFKPGSFREFYAGVVEKIFFAFWAVTIAWAWMEALK